MHDTRTDEEVIATLPKQPKKSKGGRPEDPSKPKVILPAEGTIWDECGIDCNKRKYLRRHMIYNHVMNLHSWNIWDLVLKNETVGINHLLCSHMSEMGDKPAPINFMTKITKDIMGLADYKPTTIDDVKEEDKLDEVKTDY